MKDLIQKIKNSEGFASLQPATDEQIQAAEENLKTKFAEDYKEYLRCFGVATFDGKELTGISASDRLNVVKVTEHARSYYTGFPKDAYVIEEALIDHVVTAQKADGSVYNFGTDEREEKIADSLYIYLFESGS